MLVVKYLTLLFGAFCLTGGFVLTITTSPGGLELLWKVVFSIALLLLAAALLLKVLGTWP